MPIPVAGIINSAVTIGSIFPEWFTRDPRLQRGIEAALDAVPGNSIAPPPVALWHLLRESYEISRPATTQLRGETMGFLSSIVKGIKSITSPVVKAVGSVFGAGTPIGDAARMLSPSLSRVAVPAAAAVGGAALGAAAGYAAGRPDAGQGTVGMGGNGRYVTVTTVTTIDTVTGEAVRQKMLQGSPYLMNRDLMVAKRVLRTAGKLGNRFSRKTREPSKSKQLMDAIQDRALGAVLANAAGCGHNS